MRLDEIYINTNKSPVISFEVFPPKGDNDALMLELEVLNKFKPRLISITYSAGGFNKVKSLELLKRVKQELMVEVMPHFTCVCAGRDFINKYIDEILELGIENILALKGDKPKNVDICYLDFRYANELVEHIKSKTDLAIGVAGYPEGHFEARCFDDDFDNLKRKVDAGASVIYTQLFFDNGDYFNFVEKVRASGIDIPVVPGILPVSSYDGLIKMQELSRIKVPQTFMDLLCRHKQDSAAVSEIGIEFATIQTKKLVEAEVCGLHFYTLNKSHSTARILTNLNVGL